MRRLAEAKMSSSTRVAGFAALAVVMMAGLVWSGQADQVWAAQGKAVKLKVTYEGSGEVNATNAIYVAAWDTPNIQGGAFPIGGHRRSGRRREWRRRLVREPLSGDHLPDGTLCPWRVGSSVRPAFRDIGWGLQPRSRCRFRSRRRRGGGWRDRRGGALVRRHDSPSVDPRRVDGVRRDHRRFRGTGCS